MEVDLSQQMSMDRLFSESRIAQRLTAKSDLLTDERLAILGHEIRNPLCALSYALQSWESFADDPRQMEELRQIMLRQVSQLTRLSNDLLDTGRIARGKFSVERAEVDIVKVILHACEEVQSQIDKCGHKLSVELDDSAITVIGDESRLIQVVANLLQNSAKFTHRNGNLRVSLQRTSNESVIRVCDDGRGISGSELPNIFSTNAFSKKYSAADGDGLGIGLRLVEAIVALHGGTIAAFSEGLGQGSTFEVRLPAGQGVRIDGTFPPSQHSTPKQVSSQPLPQFRIVVVDDDRSIRYLMSHMLKKIGQLVKVADNGDAAIQMILRDPPQIAFIDLQMHGITGFEVARKLRSRKELDSVVLIALSGNSEAASRELAAESGFNQYLVKPLSTTLLTETLLGQTKLSIS